MSLWWMVGQLVCLFVVALLFQAFWPTRSVVYTGLFYITVRNFTCYTTTSDFIRTGSEVRSHHSEGSLSCIRGPPSCLGSPLFSLRIAYEALSSRQRSSYWGPPSLLRSGNCPVEPRPKAVEKEKGEADEEEKKVSLHPRGVYSSIKFYLNAPLPWSKRLLISSPRPEGGGGVI